MRTPRSIGNVESIPLVAVTCLLLLFASCSGPDLDIDALKLKGISISPQLTPDECIERLGPPDQKATSKRWFWRPPRLYLKYFHQGLELAFDSEGRAFDPLSSRFVRAYVFLEAEGPYSGFSGRLSHGLKGGWDLHRLEEAMGPPARTRQVFGELEWTYDEGKEFLLVFIANASIRKIKALMILRKDRQRPIRP